MYKISKTHSKQVPTNIAIRKRIIERRRRGVSMIETALVLAIFGIMAATLIRMTNENIEQTRAIAAAQKINEVKIAAESFIRSNLAELSNTAPFPPNAQVLLAGRSNPDQGVPEGSLQAEGFLADSFIDVNGYNQRHAVLIQRGADDRINALISTYNGQIIPDDTLGLISKLIGASGGYTPSNPLPGDNGQVIGVFGGWQTQIDQWGPVETRPSAGRFSVTLQFSGGNLITGHLYRNDIGISEANRMNTSIDMNANSINGLQQITGNPNLTVSSELWVDHDLSVKKNLNVQENINAIGSIIAEESIETKAELVVGTDLEVGEDLVVSDKTNTDSLIVATDAKIQGDIETNLISATNTEINTKAVDNQKNRNFNTEVSLSDLLPNMVFQYTYQISESNNLVYKPVCAGDSQNSRILVQPLTISHRVKPNITFLLKQNDGKVVDIAIHNDETYVDFVESIYIEDFNETFWKVNWTGESVEGSSREAIAQTYCFYG